MLVTIYHHTRCSKSREALQLLEARGVPFNTRLYMEAPLTVRELKALLSKLRLQPSGLLRTGEALYKSLSREPRTEEEWLELMALHPQLMERPIVVNGRKAVVARPPERALDLL